MKFHFFLLVLPIMFCINANPSFADDYESKYQNKILRYCSESDPDSFVPSLNVSTTAQNVIIPMYGRLINFVRGSTRLTPSLAEYWQISKDAKEYTFYLQKGVKWHSNEFFQPTREFNADDLIFMIERQLRPDHPFHAISPLKHNYFRSAGFDKLIKDIVRIDDYTVKFVLSEPNTSFLHFFSTSYSGIQNFEYAMAMLKRGTPEIIDQHHIGTGPFMFVNYVKGKEINYRTFNDYWQGKSMLDGLKFIITPSPRDRVHKVLNNECDLMTSPSLEDLALLRNNPDVIIKEMSGINVTFWTMNVKKQPFNDVRVRKAFNLAVNKQLILDRIYKGSAVKASGPIPPTMWSYIQLDDDVYDPDEARRLLIEAGFPNGFFTDLWVMPSARIFNPEPRLMAEMLQADLAKIGVQVAIKTMPFDQYIRNVLDGNHTIALMGWVGQTADPDYFFYNLLSCDTAEFKQGTNFSKFCNSELDQLIKLARITADPELRIPLYQKSQQIFKQELPWIPIIHGNQYLIHRSNVINTRLSPFSINDFYGVDLLIGNHPLLQGSEK